MGKPLFSTIVSTAQSLNLLSSYTESKSLRAKGENMSNSFEREQNRLLS